MTYVLDVLWWSSIRLLYYIYYIVSIYTYAQSSYVNHYIDLIILYFYICLYVLFFVKSIIYTYIHASEHAINAWYGLWKTIRDRIVEWNKKHVYCRSSYIGTLRTHECTIKLDVTRILYFVVVGNSRMDFSVNTIRAHTYRKHDGKHVVCRVGGCKYNTQYTTVRGD